MELWQWAVYGVASTLMAIFSGIAGGGGGFVMTPLLILLGLTPAQAISTGKVSGLVITVGSLAGMRGEHGRLSKRKVIPVMLLALAVGLVVPFVIRGLDSQFYRILLGVIILLMIPVVIIKKVGIRPHAPSRGQQFAGAGLLTVALFLQGALSGGLGTLVNVVLMGMMGMTAAEAHITKRWSQIILNVVIVLGVLTSNLIAWQFLVIGVPTTLVGSYLGGRVVVRKGNQFVINVMILLMAASGLAMIFGVNE